MSSVELRAEAGTHRRRFGEVFAPRWGRSESGILVCWGPRSVHRLLPMGGCRIKVGSGGRERLPRGLHRGVVREMMASCDSGGLHVQIFVVP